MYSLLMVCPNRDKDILIADLWECGTCGITENDVPGDFTELRAFFGDGVDAAALLDRFSPYAPELHPEELTDWRKAMVENWPTIEAGRQFFIVPAWSDAAAPPGRRRLVVHPGMAYGTGTHETTQLSLEAMEEHLRPGERLLDLGCGSGILCEAAHLLGAGFIAGCDIDHEAVSIARRTIESRAVLFTGSARSVRDCSIDVAVANINAQTILNVAGDLQRLLRPGGRAVLTGFPHRDIGRVRNSITSHHLTEIALTVKGDWACMVVRP